GGAAAGVEPQFDRGRQLVDVLPAGAGTADETLLDLGVRYPDVVGHPQHDQASDAGTPRPSGAGRRWRVFRTRRRRDLAQEVVEVEPAGEHLDTAIGIERPLLARPVPVEFDAV